MELYVKFMFTLALGLVGVGMVLTTLFETVLADWDVVRDIRSGWHSLFRAPAYADSVRAEDILLEIENNYSQRRIPARQIDRRREELRDVREAESRLTTPRTVKSA